jgi:hypothetical protein
MWIGIKIESRCTDLLELDYSYCNLQFEFTINITNRTLIYNSPESQIPTIQFDRTNPFFQWSCFIITIIT